MPKLNIEKRIAALQLCRTYSNRCHWPEHNPNLIEPDWEKIYVDVFYAHLDAQGESEMGKTWQAMQLAETQCIKLLAGRRNTARSPLNPLSPVGQDS